MEILSQLRGLRFFLRLSVVVLSNEEIDVHGGNEARREVLDVHLSHVSEVSSHVGWNVELHL
jgi:hypothetical protein